MIKTNCHTFDCYCATTWRPSASPSIAPLPPVAQSCPPFLEDSEEVDVQFSIVTEPPSTTRR